MINRTSELGSLPSPSSTRGLTRRSFLAAGGAAALGLQAPIASASADGIPFGAAIQHEYFEDEAYRQAFLEHCDMIVPMNELKAGLVQWERGVFDFSRADRLVDFARDNGKSSRGHTFVWHTTNPPWLEAITEPAEAQAALVEHIERTADHFRGRLVEWDVVNEVIANDPIEDASGPLRDTFWKQLLGARYIPLAFETAARADPGAALVINDYGLEPVGPAYAAKREVMLGILRQLQDANIRVDAVGMQGHLYAHYEVDVDGIAAFKEELDRLGVGLSVTEFDVIDYRIPGGAREQDEAAERVSSDFLDAVLVGAPLRAFVTWGLTDRHSWVDGTFPRRDGAPSRPLPLDADYRPKPWYDMLRRRLAEA